MVNTLIFDRKLVMLEISYSLFHPRRDGLFGVAELGASTRGPDISPFENLDLVLKLVLTFLNV